MHVIAKACLSLRSITDCFTLRGSNVFVAALDSSKAFDKVYHYGLVLKMINARIPLLVIRAIGNFYGKLRGLVYRKGAFANKFKVHSGMRQ